MIGQSDIYPDVKTFSNSLTQLRFDIQQIEKTDMNNKKYTIYQYNYIELTEPLTRGKIVDAIISSTYSKDSELALINNEIETPGTAAYADYKLLRKHAKEVATSFGF